ncbi:response regulator [Pontibacter sp. G13]|uniref:response regulator n=1 Tax=Pontibacter sp. G13 TaxID=3074898 RepID=UPI0028893FCE|nr:response regulator [Pontibacter sp. G13]WNJ19531.1 response regulator [Pontibacter sp. G13]
MNILLIEDNPGDILLAEEALNYCQLDEYQMKVIQDGEAAVAYLKTLEGLGAPAHDIIMLDLNLPRINGLEVLKFIKTHASLRLIPVLVFSTSESLKDIHSSYSHQANCYITKPVDFDEFVAVMNHVTNFWKMAKLPTQLVA